MRTFSILLFMFLGSFCLGQTQEKESQGVSKDIANLAMELAQNGRYWDTAWSTCGLKIVEQYARYEQLKTQASNQELIFLTELPNPVVQAYAYRVLVERNDPVVFDILQKNLNNLDLLKMGSYENYQVDIYTNYYLGDFFYASVLDHNSMLLEPNYNLFYIKYYPYTWYTTANNPYIGYNRDTYSSMPKYGMEILKSLKGYKLSDQELEFIHFRLIYNPEIKLLAKTKLLQYEDFDSTDYKRIKQLYVEEEVPEAVIALARYQKPRDLEYLKELFSSDNPEDNALGLKAAQQFPDESLFPMIEKIHLQHIQSGEIDSAWIKDVYETLVNYKTKESRSLLEFSIENVRNYPKEYHFSKLAFALAFYQDPVFDGLIEQLGLFKTELKALLERAKQYHLIKRED